MSDPVSKILLTPRVMIALPDQTRGKLWSDYLQRPRSEMMRPGERVVS